MNSCEAKRAPAPIESVVLTLDLETALAVRRLFGMGTADLSDWAERYERDGFTTRTALAKVHDARLWELIDNALNDA